jgi:hypothetical protein
VCEEADGDLARDLAQKYALLYAGGMLGIRYRLLPWKKRRLRIAIAKAYRAARDLLPDKGVLCWQGLHDLRAKLRSLPQIKKESAQQTDFDKVDGYRMSRRKRESYIVSAKCSIRSSQAKSNAASLRIGW